MKRALTWVPVVFALGAAGACVSAPPAPAGSPKYPAFAAPVIPPSLGVTPEIRDRHAAAWQRLQAGDLRSASREYAACLKLSATFYPAEAGLGFVALADRQFKPAAAHFRAALATNDRYVPAWRGLIDAEIGAANADDAIPALERLVALGAAEESDRSRLDPRRLKQVQALLETARRARAAGKLDEARDALLRALALSPPSSIVLRELADTEIRLDQLEQAELHARKAVEVDPADASGFASLAAVLAARGRLSEAAAELAQAAPLDPVWRDRAASARARAEAAVLPAEMGDLGAQPTVTRAQLAALIGTRLEALIAKAPRVSAAVATDIRGHWASPWILTVIQTGSMEVFPNHTFQPAAAVRRSDLAEVASALAAIASASRPEELARWRSARPVFTDLGSGNLQYAPAALAVSAGTMTAVAGRFEPTRAATGAEALAAIQRIEQLAKRGGL
jgi:tetratricopeptide (TPR) repeat protein